MTDTLLAGPLQATYDPQEVQRHYRLAFASRTASLVGRREVMSGKAKFGIFGDGKELPQIAMHIQFRPGDFRSGYYRDQTLIFASGQATVQEFFAQLYAHPDPAADPGTAGRAMNAHFATRSLNDDGSWKALSEQPNSAADVSPTGSQMPRLVGLAYASRLYREVEALRGLAQFSHNGDEIAWGTIGNASTAEGMFWESLNAIGVLKAPAIVTIYDDGYGISVPNEFQVTKRNLSELLKGFQRLPGSQEGFDLYTVRGWDYPALLDTYRQAAETARREHIPAIVHVIELTQPQGHSTSGSHERYKTPERLAWEHEFDCLRQFRGWIVEHGLAQENELAEIENQAQAEVEQARKRAWQAFQAPILAERQELLGILSAMESHGAPAEELAAVLRRLRSLPSPLRRDLLAAAREALIAARSAPAEARQPLIEWKQNAEERNTARYGSHLYEAPAYSALSVAAAPARYAADAPLVNGFDILNACFDAALRREPRLLAFGEDLGFLGDVNQAFHGLQAKYGALRVSDTGIREVTIMGQAIGLAMRGLRPIAEIQYLDYILYALQLMSDDLANLHWRTDGGQRAPVIVRTRGHRLEGIWHSGSPMGAILHLVRGMHVLTPRNMTQAAGFYNTLLQAEEPAVVVEVLNGYRQKERLPENVGEFRLPLGQPEILRAGQDLTLLTYGACCRIALEAAEQLSRVGIESEVIDAQSLLPFDLPGVTGQSVHKTGRLLIVDEDVPGGASAYLLQEVLEKQGAYGWLDSPPRTLTGKPHRPAYGSDGDYFSKPNLEQIFEAGYELLHEANPQRYPLFYR